jgi:phosphatidylglycerol---prolipoprotein diacylglyceryl transferase
LRPELFRFFDIGFPAYFVLLLTGFSFATAIAVMWARRIGENPDVIVDLALAALLLGVIGGRLFHVLFDGYFMDYVHLCTDPTKVDWDIGRNLCESKVQGCDGEVVRGVWDEVKKVCHPPEADCFAWAKFWSGGLVYYGGLVVAGIGGVLLLKRDRFPLWKACDLGAAGIAVGLGFGRIGCTLAGCCFGSPHQGALSLIFPPHSPASDAQHKAGLLPNAAAESLPVWPTQPIEALLCFAIAGFLLLYLQSRKRYDGQVLVWFLGLYAAARFLVEFLRADDRGALLGLSTSQWIGLGLAAFAYWLHRRLSGRVSPRAAVAPR